MPSRLALLLLSIASPLFGACGDASLPPNPPPPSPTATVLAVRVTDGPGGPPLPGKLVLYDEQGAILRHGTLDYNDGQAQDLGYCDLGGGAIGTWNGIALAYGSADITIGYGSCQQGPAIPFGRYRARVMRDTEFEIFETELDLRPDRGRVALDAPLERVFSPDGLLSADLHVHAEGSGDSILPRSIRVITMAAAGIRVIGSSDHNSNGDFEDEIAALDLAPFIASLPGNEASIDIGHFNLFPVAVDHSQPRGGAPQNFGSLSAQQFFDAAHALPDRPLIQVNHARLGYAAFFDYAGWDGTSWPPPFPTDFDALEVLSGFLAFNTEGDRRLERAVDDYYTMARHGVFPTLLGNSDTHHLNLILSGFPRSYVRVPDARTSPFSTTDFIAALRGRRAMATTGPFLDVRTSEGVRPGDLATPSGGGIDLEIHVRQASYVHATRCRLFVGGELRRTLAIPTGAKVFDWSGRESVPAQDSWVVVDCAGDEPLPPDLVGDYLEWKGLGGMLPFAIINPIFVDGDGSGGFTPPAVSAVHAGPPPDVFPRAGMRASEYDCGEN